MTYTSEAIQGALTLLNNIETHGIENAKRIVMIAQILQNPEKEKDDGSKDSI